MKPSVGSIAAVAAIAFALVAGSIVRTRAAETAKAASLSSLLKSAGFDVVSAEQGWLRTTMSYKGEFSFILAREIQLGSTSDDKFKLGSLTCEVVDVPKGFHHPAAMLKKVGELNDRLQIGRLSVDPESGSIWYTSSFWLRTADEQIVVNEMFLAHTARQDLKKELAPFVTE